MQATDWAPEQHWRLNLKLGHYRRPRSLDLEVFSRFFALVGNEVVFDLLTLIEGAEAGAFDRRNMNENVLAAATSLLNKTIGHLEK